GRIAVYRHERALGTEQRPDGARVPAAPERAVDGHLARPRVQQGDELGGEDWYVALTHLDQCGHSAPPLLPARQPLGDLLGGRLDLGVVRRPALRVPDL